MGAFGSFLDPAVCVAMGASRAVTDPQLRKAAEEFWRSCDGTAHVADPLVTYSNDLTPERPAKKPKRERKPRDPSPYNVFIREEIPRLKAENPTMTHRDAFKTAARNWAGSSLNMRSAAYVMPAPVLADAGAAAEAATVLKAAPPSNPTRLRARRFYRSSSPTCSAGAMRTPRLRRRRRRRRMRR